MSHKREIVVGLCTLVILTLVVLAYINKNVFVKKNTQETATTTPGNPEPTRADFGTKLPTDFPANIPTEQNTSPSQSYILDYQSQKQLTVIKPTTKTIKENYALYADFLKKDGWSIVNKYESATVSSLYGRKGDTDINVTITKEQVSVSVLKK